jgi:hypothetical protein
MGEFIFNEHGCCINPEKIVVINDKHFFAYINLASKDEIWCYGFRIQYNGGSVGCGGYAFPVSFKWEQFGSRELALEKAVNEILKEVKERGNHPSGRSNKVLIEKLEILFPKQMELFT